MKHMNEIHKVYHKFDKWMWKTFGKDLITNSQMLIGTKTIKYKSYNELEFSKRLVGYEVIEKIEKYCKKYCPEIKIVNCDDSLYAGSIILLIPHKDHGITIMFIPQCTQIQNQFFLYQNHFKKLNETLKELENIYETY